MAINFSIQSNNTFHAALNGIVFIILCALRLNKMFASSMNGNSMYSVRLPLR